MTRRSPGKRAESAARRAAVCAACAMGSRPRSSVSAQPVFMFSASSSDTAGYRPFLRCLIGCSSAGSATSASSWGRPALSASATVILLGTTLDPVRSYGRDGPGRHVRRRWRVPRASGLRSERPADAHSEPRLLSEYRRPRRCRRRRAPSGSTVRSTWSTSASGSARTRPRDAGRGAACSRAKARSIGSPVRCSSPSVYSSTVSPARQRQLHARRLPAREHAQRRGQRGLHELRAPLADISGGQCPAPASRIAAQRRARSRRTGRWRSGRARSAAAAVPGRRGRRPGPRPPSRRTPAATPAAAPSRRPRSGPEPVTRPDGQAQRAVGQRQRVVPVAAAARAGAVPGGELDARRPAAAGAGSSSSRRVAQLARGRGPARGAGPGARLA